MAPANLRARVITALVLTGLLAFVWVEAYFFCAGQYLFTSLQLAVSGLCAYELARICEPSLRGRRFACFVLVLLPPLIALGSLAPARVCEWDVDGPALLGRLCGGMVVSSLLGAVFVMACARDSLDDAARMMRSFYPGLFLVGFGGAAWIGVPLFGGGLWHFLWLVAVVCVNDIAAYFTGSTVGGPKLAPAISPNKTVSGSLGGFAAGILLGVALSALLPLHYGSKQAAALAAVVVLAGQTGDLIKSYLKRLSEVKDSGSLLPGHGGFLDRLDGILAAAPILCLWLSFR